MRLKGAQTRSPTHPPTHTHTHRETHSACEMQVGQFAEHFSGYGQQDSMELFEYVLDGLKEDCNRAQKEAKCITVADASGRNDEESTLCAVAS